ncbi:MAG: transglycosylase SLT domain-containing protein [Thermodesulfobacteriota bacterium]
MRKIVTWIFLSILLCPGLTSLAVAGFTDNCPDGHYGPVAEVCAETIAKPHKLLPPPMAHRTLGTESPYFINDNAAGEDPAEDALPEIPIIVNNSVESFIKYFQTSGRPYFKKWLARMGGYRTLVEETLHDEGMPEDLFYVALIESGLNPKARSDRKAVGMWQFIRATARRYGLRVDWWIDERMDPEMATIAASKYLKRLYERFGSWQLAMAGYNAGEGRIARAIKTHKTNDFWKLSRYRRPLNKETRQYIPKFMAAALIAKDPESYGFTDLVYDEQVVYEKVAISHATDIKVIAEAADISIKELKDLNPALIRWFTPPDYSDYHIKLPPEKVEIFKENFSKIAPKDRLKFYKHRVRRGDTLWAIARKYRTGMSLILYLNDVKNPRYIRPGKLIVIPVRARATKKHPLKKRASLKGTPTS